MANSIDVVIPSFRLDEKYLIPIITLTKPAGFNVTFYIVSDNPFIEIPPNLNNANVMLDDLHIIINAKNLGFSATRNIGIDAAKGDWILFLDDDITPDDNLLHAYADAIQKKPNALGFVGVTNFPPEINAVTKALQVNGVSTHFQLALQEPEMYWSATANIMLKRSLLATRRFNTGLKKSTEDMELLFRNAFENNLKKYISVPNAVVTHPWWDSGKAQTKRMFKYGSGAAEAARLYPIELYTYYDFTNTTETTVLLLVLAMVFAIFSLPVKWLIITALAQWASEFFTNYYKAFKTGKTLSIAVVLQMMWHKNVLEAGRLWVVLSTAHLDTFALRIDGSFRKQHPQHFRLNRWKIIKMLLFLISIFLLWFYASL